MKGKLVVRKKNMEESSQCAEVKNRRLTTFAFKAGENGIDIKIIGCLKVKTAPSQPFYSKGTILFDGNVFSVFDMQALAGLRPKRITDESCVVLVNSDDCDGGFNRAIIVDDVAEMLRIAEHNMEGLAIGSLFGRGVKLSSNISPDFPDVHKGANCGRDAIDADANEVVSKNYVFQRN